MKQYFQVALQNQPPLSNLGVPIVLYHRFLHLPFFLGYDIPLDQLSKYKPYFRPLSPQFLSSFELFSTSSSVSCFLSKVQLF